MCTKQIPIKKYKYVQILCIHSENVRIHLIRSRNLLPSVKNCTFIIKTYAFVITPFTCINSDPNLNLFPLDVINHGTKFGLIGVKTWPLHTAEEVHNLIDQLPEEYCDDFNRVFIFKNLSSLNQFTLLIYIST